MSNYHQRPNFNSPPMPFQTRHSFQRSPDMHQGNRHFLPRGSPYLRSPTYNNSNMHLPRNSSPFYPRSRAASRSFNNSTGSPDQWSYRTNQTYSSDSSSSSNFGDVSHVSPYSSPRSSPHYSQNTKRFQRKQNFHSFGSNDSNPGHSQDIRLYVDKSMLEDPWKDLIAEMEKKSN